MNQNGNNFLFSETTKMKIGPKCKDQKCSFTYFKGENHIFVLTFSGNSHFGP